MKVKVVDPKVWLLTSVEEGRRQLARCAFAAGLSRGRLDVIDVPPDYSGEEDWDGRPGDLAPDGTEHAPIAHTAEGEIYPPCNDERRLSFDEAEALVGRLLAIKPYPHETVIEHSAISFLFRMSRIASHELVRHRLTAITQQSTRYCESGKDGSVTFIRPLDRPESDCGEWPDPELEKALPGWVIEASHSIEGYRAELEDGRKREYVRYLLPHCLEVWLQMTTNFREWRHIIRLRTSKAAAPEMRLLIGQVRDELAKISPVLVEGL